MTKPRGHQSGPSSIQALRKTVAYDKVLVFSGYPSKTVHTDRAIARARGLPDVIGQGLQTYAYMCEWLVKYFGKDWFDGGMLSVSFLSIVLPGDVVTVEASIVLTKRVGDGIEVVLDIWCENQRAEKVAAGTAKGFTSDGVAV